MGIFGPKLGDKKNKKVTCYECEGRGFNYGYASIFGIGGKRKCSTCKGRGYTLKQITRVKCYYCEGKKCRHCDETGLVWSDAFMYAKD